MDETPLTPQEHLRAELARLLLALRDYLERQRVRGRTSAGDAVAGYVIEDGEAEGLIGQLSAELNSPPSDTAPRELVISATHPGIAERAREGAVPDAFLPLYHAATAFELRPREYGVLLLALAVELDSRFGRLIAYLNDHAGRTRPTLGLALAIQANGDCLPLYPPAAMLERPFIRDGLVEIEGEGPGPGLAFRLQHEMVRRLSSGSRLDGSGKIARLYTPNSGLLDRLVLDEPFRQKLRAWGRAIRQRDTVRPLIVHGMPGSGRTTAACAAASEAGLPTIAVPVSGDRLVDSLRLARRECRWHEAAVLLQVSAGEPKSVEWSQLWSEMADLLRPIILEVSDTVAPDAAAAAPKDLVVIGLREPGVAARAQLWARMLPHPASLNEPDVANLAGRFRFNPGRIARAIRRADTEASFDPSRERCLDLPLLERACREIGSAAMGSLAQKLPLPYTRQDLVVPDRVRAELDLGLAWVRHQNHVLEQWDFGRRVAMGRGLTALFAGHSGTGKTMAAQVLARELALELYRVDLSQVMSKYIGETEKNLGRLFDEAHAACAVLFFDEADALFGKRSEVKDAHDRYANVEIGYLLQRMEEYDGVTVLATNRMRDMDEAFLRRFHIIVDFPLPDEPDRLRIWQGIFPEPSERAPDLDLNLVAREFELTGGEIKNCGLAAAYMAAAESTSIGMVHLRRAIRRELIKGGKVIYGE